MMGSTRVSDEWGFGKIRQRCPFVATGRLQIQKQDVSMIVRVSVLLTNATHACTDHIQAIISSAFLQRCNNIFREWHYFIFMYTMMPSFLLRLPTRGVPPC